MVTEAERFGVTGVFGGFGRELIDPGRGLMLIFSQSLQVEDE